MSRLQRRRAARVAVMAGGWLVLLGLALGQAEAAVELEGEAVRQRHISRTVNPAIEAMGTAIVSYGACALIKGIMRDEVFLSPRRTDDEGYTQ